MGVVVILEGLKFSTSPRRFGLSEIKIIIRILIIKRGVMSLFRK